MAKRGGGTTGGSASRDDDADSQKRSDAETASKSSGGAGLAAPWSAVSLPTTAISPSTLLVANADAPWSASLVYRLADAPWSASLVCRLADAPWSASLVCRLFFDAQTSHQFLTSSGIQFTKIIRSLTLGQ
ncbi:hypothetical protein QYE76_029586 [Lolium multiflorum]|uniref:Uncharacterized protein n=1 Tax=Lolium multiflorum TaxID=4521 RepID=A0AAD8VID9_LOLMU|nr:hypothetical protein QYE76_029586 [Lolium multiflorum]